MKGTHPMLGDESQTPVAQVVTALLHPSAVPLVDLFRASRGAAQLDLLAVDSCEAVLSRWTSAELAKAIVSDALLLIITLRRRGTFPFDALAQGSRRMTAHETAFLCLISISANVEDTGLFAQVLGIAPGDLPLGVMANLSRKIAEAGLSLPHGALDHHSAPTVLGATVLGAVVDDATFKFRP